MLINFVTFILLICSNVSSSSAKSKIIILQSTIFSMSNSVECSLYGNHGLFIRTSTVYALYVKKKLFKEQLVRSNYTVYLIHTCVILE